MALTVSCPKCRASMSVDEKFLGKAGKCSKCGEQFTMTPNSSEPARQGAPVPNPFANPFGAAESEPAVDGAGERPDSRPEFLFAPPPPSRPPSPVSSGPTPAEWGPFGGPPEQPVKEEALA